jgi:hypothetical protein
MGEEEPPYLPNSLGRGRFHPTRLGRRVWSSRRIGRGQTAWPSIQRPSSSQSRQDTSGEWRVARPTRPTQRSARTRPLHQGLGAVGRRAAVGAAAGTSENSCANVPARARAHRLLLAATSCQTRLCYQGCWFMVHALTLQSLPACCVDTFPVCQSGTWERYETHALPRSFEPCPGNAAR